MSSDPLVLAVEQLAAGESLSAAQCQEAVAAILDKQAPEAQTSAFLTALHQKGESADELLGAVRAIRQRMIALDSGPAVGDRLDTCGTGGDGAETVNVSTAAAIVLAACGVRVVKHGNRAATGRSGSSDVLERLGVAVDVETSVLGIASTSWASPSCSHPGFIPGCARGGGAAAASVSDHLQPGGPALQPGQPHASARRCSRP